MKHALHNGTHIISYGMSREDADRMAGEQGLTVIEVKGAIDIYASVVDGGVIREATQTEQDAHPRNAASIARNAINARLRDDRDNRGRDGMPKLADMVNDILQKMNLDDE